MDAVHPQHNTMAAYGWIERGQKREIPTSSGRACGHKPQNVRINRNYLGTPNRKLLIMPGMLATVHIKTGKTVLQYI